MLSIRTHKRSNYVDYSLSAVWSIQLKLFKSFKELGLKIGDEFILLDIKEGKLTKTKQKVKLLRIDNENDAVGYFDVIGYKYIEMIPFFKLAKIIRPMTEEEIDMYLPQYKNFLKK